MKHEVTIKYGDLSDHYLEMLMDILVEAGLDEKADEVKDYMNGKDDEEDEGWGD